MNEGNKYEWIQFTYENMNESQNTYTELKKPNRKSTICMIPLI